MEGQGEVQGSVTALKGESLGYHRTVYNSVRSVCVCGGGVSSKHFHFFLVPGKEDMPFHLLVGEQEGSMADSSPDSLQ